ncbi:M35 family metallopeptidase [Burkholderia contaminans]|nr:M35 family metallopeptidase [Burkholderia contaminans]
MIVTFPFEDDPYYSAPPPASYKTSNGAALTTPALSKKYFDLAKSVSGGVFPVGMNRFWHGGVHLKGTKPIRAVADGTIVAYRLDSDYTPSAFDAQVASGAASSRKPPREFSSSFVLIRHECEVNNGVTTVDRYTGAHFYSLYANLMPAKHLHDKPLLPPFLTTGERLLTVYALRGDEVTVVAVKDDAHRMVKVRVTDINSNKVVEGWVEHLYLDLDPEVPLVESVKVRIGYPISWVYAHHPSERVWRKLDSVRTIDYPVRVGEVIGYAGKTDGPGGVLDDSFHFEIFTAENALVKPMKPLVPVEIKDPARSHQKYVDGKASDGMGKVWLTRAAMLGRKHFDRRLVNILPADLTPFPQGSCFLAAIPCGRDGAQPISDSDLICFKLFAMDGAIYYAYANEASATSDGRSFVLDAWVTLTTDSDWEARGWKSYVDSELNAADDGFVEDDDAVMKAILSRANKTVSALSLDDLRADGVEGFLRTTTVQFHTEWDSKRNDTRYKRLRTGGSPSLPQLTDAQFKAFLQDIQQQQFWRDAKIKTDGVSRPEFQPLSDRMNAKSWHFHPIGFLAQMRECLTTDAWLSEESFEQEIRHSWVIGLKFIERRLKQLESWANANAPLPEEPVSRPIIVREYATLHMINNVSHFDFWSNFEYWFGTTPNDVARPETLHGKLAAAPAGWHVYRYLKGMRDFFKHISMLRLVKGALGFQAGAWVYAGEYPNRKLIPAKSGFKMECINIGCQYGPSFISFKEKGTVDQNRMEVQLHEVAHLENTAHAKDQKIELAATVLDPEGFDANTAYGARRARVLAEFTPDRALANAENIAFFIESVKNEK